MSIAYLFPGQGSQYPGMLHDLPKHWVVNATVEEAATVLGTDVMLFDREQELLSTRAVQLALLISGVSVGRVLKEQGVTPSMVAGHSVGAFAAAVISNSISFADAVRIIDLRGKLMEEAYPNGYGMGVVVGLSKRQVLEIIEQFHQDDNPVFLANINAPAQMTISGKRDAITSVLHMAQKAGARKSEMLNVAIPSHCPLLKPVSEKLKMALKNMDMATPDVTYITNKHARPTKDSETIRNDLALSVASSVQWHEATTICYELGVRLFIEMPPGQVLTDLAEVAFPEARSISINKSGLESAVMLAQRKH